MIQNPLAVALLFACALPAQIDPIPRGSDDAALEAVFEKASDRAGPLRDALATLDGFEHVAFRHLLCGMPAADLRALDAAFLLGEVEAAIAARSTSAFGARIPDEVFLDAVLPYAHVTETRESWRADLRARCLPMIEGCASPGEAARRINERLFREVGVRYATTRRRADQSPSETIEQGVASCTGLSILLADACRAVGVPARLCGIAEWPGKGGNHTWVEVWDFDGWHFVGAAEPDPRGLDHTWFEADAARATPGDARHGIWALTWHPTGHRFPLVWSRGEGAHAIDVTARYLPHDLRPHGIVRVEIDVVDGERGPRVPARVALFERNVDGALPPAPFALGVTRDARSDTNDHLAFQVPAGRHLIARIGFGSRALDVDLGEAVDSDLRRTVVLAAGPDGESELRAAATAWFAARPDAREAVDFDARADAFVRSHEDAARSVVDAIWRAAPLWDEARTEFGNHIAKTVTRESAYTVKTVGERGATGYGLVIAMHGGGNVKPEVNDSQWRHMQIYYKDHGEVGGYHYVALRAPNDSWNGFYDDAIAPLIERLIRDFVLFGDVDPDRVIAIGYSHGGYGAFVIGPKIPDRFAAVHASASAPTDGETAAANLRNLRFSFMVGGKDTAYGRLDRCNAFDALIRSFKERDPDGYPVRYTMVPGNPHTGLPDRDLLAELLPARRAPAPPTLVWEPTDGVLEDQYWLHVAHPADGQRYELHLDGTRLSVTAPGDAELDIGLDRRLLGASDAIEITRDGVSRRVVYAPSARTLCAETLRRSDARLAFPMRVRLAGKDG